MTAMRRAVGDYLRECGIATLSEAQKYAEGKFGDEKLVVEFLAEVFHLQAERQQLARDAERIWPEGKGY